MPIDFDAFLKACSRAQNITLTAPAGADGDSVGTQCAMLEIFSIRFPTIPVFVVNEDPCPLRYRFLEHTEKFLSGHAVTSEQKSQMNDMWICVDGSPNRLGEATTILWKAAKTKGQIDHHRITQKFDIDVAMNDPTAAATTEIVYDFCEYHKIAMTPTLAEALYAGLIYDTGLFKHPNTTPRVMRIGADLLEQPFNHTLTAEQTLLVRNEANISLLKKLLNGMIFDCSGKYVWAKLLKKDFIEARAGVDDREGLIDFLFLTENCIVAALYSEVEPGKWKASFRSRAPDVAQVAKTLDPDGGGHLLASGCTLNGSAESLDKAHEILRKIVSDTRVA